MKCNFEVLDAVQKLERLGIVARVRLQNNHFFLSEKILIFFSQLKLCQASLCQVPEMILYDHPGKRSKYKHFIGYRLHYVMH